ncbi:heparinase II/III-family protein [Microvirga terrae]|uniref:Heparinase II/III-family protein n=1 Tax=Microvirga terrae TaxID=2740529 RepID=A0ABY5RSN4_9HYPH|nr:heparinase II/III family protein [Microvirga terrae]UVF20265.1 heparinase II/III-family protein [Microvirga terrae]
MPEVTRILPVPRDQAAEGSANPGDDIQVVANHNRWSRAVYEFRDVSNDAWCELNFLIAWHQEETSRAVQDFAAVGFDFLTEDGSSIEFAYVPGLSRSQIDPHSYHVAGPAFYDRSSEHSHSALVGFRFFIPAPAKRLTVTIRSWRNSHPFTISNLRIEQKAQSASDNQEANSEAPVGGSTVPASRRPWWGLSTTPRWQRYGIVPGHPLFVRGQLVNHGPEGDGALARVVFRDAQGNELKPPYEGVSSSSIIDAYIDIPVHRQTRRFTLELNPPAGAALVELGFQAWRDEAAISLVTPLEVTAGEDLLLENILEEDRSDPLDFLEAVRNRLGGLPGLETRKAPVGPVDWFGDAERLTSPMTFHDRLKAVQHGEEPTIIDNRLALGGQEPWPIPDVFEWTEDPYHSSSWRLEFQSLSWLLDLARSPAAGGSTRAVDLALAWIQSNPWGHSRDPLSTYPLSMATRAEVFLRLVALAPESRRRKGDRRQNILLAETMRYGFALSEILSQNIFPASDTQLRTACALLAIAEATPLFPMASYWKSVALSQLRSGFDQLINHDGSSIEQSLHNRLEIMSAGLLLVESLRKIPEGKEFQDSLEARLKRGLRTIVGITDPAGMLPPLGEAPRGYHHASWLRRLISKYGRSLLSDPELAAELSYPPGPRIFVAEADGVVVFRNYEHKPHWSYLCASFGEQRHENGHFDCSSFVYVARGVRWITDPGGSSHNHAGPTRHYLVSPAAHNIAIPEGCNQSSGHGWVESRTTFDNVNVIRIGTNVFGPRFEHTRTIMCLDNLDAVAIFDRFRSSGENLSFDGHFHFAEGIAVALANANLAIGFRDKSRLRMIPHEITGQHSGMRIQNGCNDRPSSLQGFLSHPSGGLQPANVLTYKFSGSGEVCGGMILTISDQGLRRILDLLAEQEVRSLLA